MAAYASPFHLLIKSSNNCAMHSSYFREVPITFRSPNIGHYRRKEAIFCMRSGKLLFEKLHRHFIWYKNDTIGG
jgi:hypothetical protein